MVLVFIYLAAVVWLAAGAAVYASLESDTGNKPVFDWLRNAPVLLEGCGVTLAIWPLVLYWAKQRELEKL